MQLNLMPNNDKKGRILRQQLANTKATGNSRSGIYRNPSSKKIPTGIPRNFLILAGNFPEFRKFMG